MKHVQISTWKSTGRVTRLLPLIFLALLVLGFAATAQAQTNSFAYQGQFTDGGSPANGNYDMHFLLWDSLSGGTQIGNPFIAPGVPVSNGDFFVVLAFPGAFSGADRFIEVAVRFPNDQTYTTLTPRHQILSVPYAIRSSIATVADTATLADTATTAIDATQLGGIGSEQYVQSNDQRLSDSRTPTAGSSNYIQNGTNQQASSNFNISGNGTAGGTFSGNIVNVTTQYNLLGGRVLSAPGIGNFFAGPGAGLSNTNGHDNSFFGNLAGSANATGDANSFFGVGAGLQSNGNYNSFFGQGAGQNVTNGSSNTMIGTGADVSNATITNATAIGAFARVVQSNSLVLGSINGNGAATHDTNVGIGTPSPTERLTVQTATGNYGFVHTNGTITVGSWVGGSTGGGWYGTKSNHPLSFFVNNGGPSMTITTGNKVGIGTPTPAEKLTVQTATSNYGFVQTDGNITVGSWVGGSTGGGWYGTKSNHPLSFFVNNGGPSLTITTGGLVSITNLSLGGSTALCRSNQNLIAVCSSSLRYKTDVQTFSGGLAVVNRLRPISFTWKDGGMRDIGLGAEEVDRVAPLLTFRNDKGEVEGVKYNQLSAVFINAFKEQQAQIQQQQEQLDYDRELLKRQQESARRQDQALDGLRKLVCSSHRHARVCKN